MFEKFDYIENESMKKHTTLHIGGNARWFLLPKNENELKDIVCECESNKLRYFVLGNGSNLLVDDAGFDGVVVSTEMLNQIKLCEEEVEVDAGVKLFALNLFCRDHSLSGLEWSYGIPGTVGGACCMNAGAFGGEFCSKIKKIKILCGGKIFERKKIRFSYRKGCLNEGEILLSATLSLKKSKKSKIQRMQEQYLNLRKEKQPYDFHSLGSVFKKGKDFSPAYLIESFGLKGLRRGDIQVSRKHAGFVINKKNGRAKDFLAVVELIENVARSKGYKFEREFTMLGFDK